MLFSVEQAFVGRDEKRAPLKTPAWEARLCRALQGQVGLCAAMQGYVGLCRAMYSYVGLCRAMQGYVGLCRAMYGYVWLCMCMYGYLYLCIAVYGYVGLCTACRVMQGYAVQCYKQAYYILTNVKPLYDAYTTYLPVDDTFTAVCKDQMGDFHEHLNRHNAQIKFPNGKIPFLDCLITRDNNRLRTTIYRKPAHTERLLDQSSYNPTSHKATTIRTLTRRAQLVCDSSDYVNSVSQ